MKYEKGCCSKNAQPSHLRDFLSQMELLTQERSSSSSLGTSKVLSTHSSCFAPIGITALGFTGIEKRVIALLASQSKYGAPTTLGFFCNELPATWMVTPASSALSGSE